MQWIQRTADRALVDSLVTALRSDSAFRALDNGGILPILAPLLVRRAILDSESAQRFLFPSVAHLHSPQLMSGLQTAVDRIEAAIEHKETILIYGDYDVDGTMAVIILK